jgi:hypothetical protein
MFCFIILTMTSVGRAQLTPINVNNINYISPNNPGSYVYFNNKEVYAVREGINEILGLIDANCPTNEGNEALFKKIMLQYSDE